MTHIGYAELTDHLPLLTVGAFIEHVEKEKYRQFLRTREEKINKRRELWKHSLLIIVIHLHEIDR